MCKVDFQVGNQKLINLQSIRYQFEQKFERRIDDYDYFALYYEITQRGGEMNVETRGDWKSVQDSLYFQDKSVKELQQIYQEHLRGYEKREYQVKSEEIQQHQVSRVFLPPRTILNKPYPQTMSSSRVNEDEINLMRKIKITSKDQFVCMRSLILCEKDKSSYLSTINKINKRTRSEELVDKINEVYLFYIIQFSLDLNLYDSLYRKGITQLSNLKYTLQDKQVAIFGMSLRNIITAKYLSYFGIKCDIFYDTKADKENKLLHNEIMEYAPIFIDSSRFSSIMKFLSTEKLHYFMYQSHPMKIYDKNGDHLNESLFVDEYLDILEQIRLKPDSDLILNHFYSILNQNLPRHQLVRQEDKRRRSGLIFLFNRMFWICKMRGKQTTVKDLKFQFQLDDMNFLLHSICGDRLYMFKDCFKSYLKSLNGRDIYYKNITEIRQIRSKENKTTIDFKGKLKEYDFLIYGHSNDFIKSLKNRFSNQKQNAPLVDNPHFDSNIINKLYNFGRLEQENITHFGLFFSEVLWERDQVFSMTDERGDEKDVIFFMDGSNCNHLFGPKKSFLLIATMFVGKDDFRDVQQTKLFLLKSLASCLKEKPDLLESKLMTDISIIYGSYFVPKAEYDVHDTYKKIINPIQGIYFNIPLFANGWGDMISNLISNSLYIITDIVSICQNQNEPKLKIETKIPHKLQTVQQILDLRNEQKFQSQPVPVPIRIHQEVQQIKKFYFDQIPIPIPIKSIIIEKKVIVEAKVQIEQKPEAEEQPIPQIIILDKLNYPHSQQAPQKETINRDNVFLQKVGLIDEQTLQYNQFYNFMQETSRDSMIYLLEIRKPVEYIKNSFILQYGQNILKQNSSITEPNVNFMSVVLLPNFQKPCVISQFLFSKIMINEQIFYTLIPEDNQSIILYHTNSGKLWESVKNTNKKTNINKSNFDPSMINMIRFQVKSSFEQNPLQTQTQAYEIPIDYPLFDPQSMNQINHMSYHLNQICKSLNTPVKQLGDMICGTSHPYINLLLQMTRKNKRKIESSSISEKFLNFFDQQFLNQKYPLKMKSFTFHYLQNDQVKCTISINRRFYDNKVQSQFKSYQFDISYIHDFKLQPYEQKINVQVVYTKIGSGKKPNNQSFQNMNQFVKIFFLEAFNKIQPQLKTYQYFSDFIIRELMSYHQHSKISNKISQMFQQTPVNIQFDQFKNELSLIKYENGMSNILQSLCDKYEPFLSFIDETSLINSYSAEDILKQNITL